MSCIFTNPTFKYINKNDAKWSVFYYVITNKFIECGVDISERCIMIINNYDKRCYILQDNDKALYFKINDSKYNFLFNELIDDDLFFGFNLSIVFNGNVEQSNYVDFGIFSRNGYSIYYSNDISVNPDYFFKN